MKIVKKSFGVIPKELPADVCLDAYVGKEIFNYVLSNDNGMSVTVSEFGAVIIDIMTPDKDGHIDDMILGFDDLKSYIENRVCFGAPVGRNANRISEHSFTINGVFYELPDNDSGCNLHSCIENNYYRRVWDFVETKESASEVSVTFHLFSPDGDQGYPGNMDIYITYGLKNDGSLVITYKGRSDKDTLFNMTNHSFFNLAGESSGKCLDQLVFIDAPTMTENRKGNVPTGRIIDVRGTELDFTVPKPLGQDIFSDNEMIVNAKGYDFNYILDNGGKLKLCASLKHPTNGRVMEVYTDLPGIQIYSGNYLNNAGKNGHVYKDYDGVCFESHIWPDAIHHDNFPNPVLKADTDFVTQTVYKFFVEK